jgi:Xaa-Pro aminopeptidase
VGLPAEEYRGRVEGARRRMAGVGLDALFLTGERNIRDVTGFHTQIWSARPGCGTRTSWVTRNGYELLTRRGPAELPVIA